VTRLIRRRRGRRLLRHLCLHSREDGSKDDGRGDRRGLHADIRGQEEVGDTTTPSAWSNKSKSKNKNNINNSGGNV
jgi:hypothetical protein